MFCGSETHPPPLVGASWNQCLRFPDLCRLGTASDWVPSRGAMKCLLSHSLNQHELVNRRFMPTSIRISGKRPLYSGPLQSLAMFLFWTTIPNCHLPSQHDCPSGLWDYRTKLWKELGEIFPSLRFSRELGSKMD